MTRILATEVRTMTSRSLGAALQLRNVFPPAIRVTLRLASRSDREERGLAGRLVASIDPMMEKGTPHFIIALIHIEGVDGKPFLGEPDCPDLIPTEMMERVKSALDEAWRTARNVDLVDEQGRPLLLGALNVHPAGVTRWLTHHFHEDR